MVCDWVPVAGTVILAKLCMLVECPGFDSYVLAHDSTPSASRMRLHAAMRSVACANVTCIIHRLLQIGP